MRSKVDLPQPEGPTRTTKAPSSIGIDTPCSTSKPPNDFRTSRICTDDMSLLPNRRQQRQTRDRLDLIGSYQTFSIESLDQSRKPWTQASPPAANRCEGCGGMRTSAAN